MKKIILVLSIVVIAVLNFTLVKSKTGDITLKSLTELSKANADEGQDHPSYTTITNCHSYIQAISSCYTSGGIYFVKDVVVVTVCTYTDYIWNGSQYIAIYIREVPSYSKPFQVSC